MEVEGEGRMNVRSDKQGGKQNKYAAFLVLMACIAIICFFSISLVKDIAYFSGKKETVANVLEIYSPEAHRRCRITLRYYNDYVGEEVTCSISEKKSVAREITKGNSKAVNLNYGRGFPENVYLADYRTPTAGVILIDLLAIGVIIIAVRGILGSLIPARKTLPGPKRLRVKESPLSVIRRKRRK